MPAGCRRSNFGITWAETNILVCSGGPFLPNAPPSPQRVPDCQSSTAVFLSDDLSLLVCGPYVYENDTPQECLLHAKMSLSFLIAEIYVYASACGRGFRCHNRRLVYNHVEVVYLHLRSVFLPFFSLQLLCLWEFVVASLTAAVKRPPSLKGTIHRI